MILENQRVAEGFSLRIGLQYNTDPETQPEGCGYQEIIAPKGPPLPGEVPDEA